MHENNLSRSSSLFYCWFPAVPFIGYWVFSYVMNLIGPFYTPNVEVFTHIYFLLCLSVFTTAYWMGLGNKRLFTPTRECNDSKTALKTLSYSSSLACIGTLLFVYDRISSGAGSFSVVQNDLSSIREGMSMNVTLLTTLSVFPHSFKLVAFASYFYCLMRKLNINLFSHFAMAMIAVAEILNMILSANRGALFWLISFAFFYTVMCAKVRLSVLILSRKNLFVKIFFIFVLIIAYFYFTWVAENRVVASTAEYLGAEAYSLLKSPDSYSFKDYSSLSGEYQLFYYLTHGFQYMDAILKSAPIVHFDFLSPSGIRVEAQISRFIDGYMHPAKANILNWIDYAGLNLSGWPSVFGAALAYFGVIGSVVFFWILGYISAYAVKKWIVDPSLGRLIIVFLIFSSLNISFDWIVRDFDQYMALLVGWILIRRNSIAKI